MNYISRKGGSVTRNGLLANRVNTGKSKDYEKCLDTLCDSGFISESKCEKSQNVVFSTI